MFDAPRSKDNALSLLDARLKSLGIEIPDQKRAAHVMELTRLKYVPNAKVTRLDMLLRQLEIYFGDDGSRNYKKRHRYRIFSVAEHDSDASNWGGRMPAEVRNKVELIKQHLPDVKLEVHATYDDPYLLADSGAGKRIIGGWYRESPSHDVRLINL